MLSFFSTNSQLMAFLQLIVSLKTAYLSVFGELVINFVDLFGRKYVAACLSPCVQSALS
jgi:hypothetical protein